MTIGLVLDDGLDKPDGVQQYVLTLGMWLVSQGHTVHYIVGQTKRIDIPNLHSMSRNISVRFNHNYATMPLPASKKKIRSLLAGEEFDVLHVQMPFSPFMAARIIGATNKQTAVVGTFHILPFSRINAAATHLLGTVLKPSLKRFDQIASVSPPAQEFAKQSMGINSVVIPNAVDIDQMSHGAPLDKYKDGKTNILFLGRLVERKGCIHLLRAVDVLQKQNKLSNVRVVIGGKGPLEDSLKDFVKDNNLAQIVEFAGFIEESQKANYLASADIAVFPSTGGESFGIVLVEAMASGAGVVLAGDNPGYRSVLGENEEMLVNPTDSTVFATALEKLINNEPLRQSLHAQQQQIMKRYDVNVVGQQLLKLYQEALRRRRVVR
jgi:phosphatidylinositol alpha-mannosyltransferase